MRFSRRSVFEIECHFHFRMTSFSTQLFQQLLLKDILSTWEIIFLSEASSPVIEKTFLDYATNNYDYFQKDYLFLNYTLTLMFSRNCPRDELFCKCGQPRRGSNNSKWIWSNLLEKNIQYIVANYTLENDRDVILKFRSMFYENG